MTPVQIYGQLSAIEHIVNANGFNYEISLGFQIYSNCNSLTDLVIRLKESYPIMDTHHLKLTISSAEEFWTAFDDGFAFQGDERGGYGPKKGTYEKVQPLLVDYKEAITWYLTAASRFYTCPYPNGIPGYPVFWEYCFVIDVGGGTFLFIFGSSSD